jgi:hypothetical protein
MKLGNLYNLASFEAFCDSASRQQGFTDAYAGTVLARNLTAIDPRVFEKKFPELALINSGIEADNSGGYARRIQSLRLQDTGGFTTSGDSSSDKGKISLAGEDSFLKVVERESHSKWTDSEIREAELQNINLPQRYIQAHNSIYMREVDAIGLTGGVGNEGLLNYSGFDSDTSAAISTLTPEQMYSAIGDAITTQRNAVNNTPEYSGNRVITSVAVLNKLQATILNTAGGSMSVLAALRANFPDVEFMSSFRAANAGAGGVSTTVVYSNNSEVMKMRIPQPLTIGEIIKLGSFDYQVDSKYRIAGLDVLEDTGGFILTGL